MYSAQPRAFTTADAMKIISTSRRRYPTATKRVALKSKASTKAAAPWYKSIPSGVFDM